MENTIKAIMTFEMMGKPADYLKETMEKFVETLGKEEGIIIKDKKIYAPKKIENKDENGKLIINRDEIFSTFCEIELELKDMFRLLGLAFKYLPSHVEIIEPEEFKMRNNDFNAIVNEILSKLHNYDAIAKSALINNQLLAKKMQEIMQVQEGQSPKTTGVPLSISYGNNESVKKSGLKRDKKLKKKK
jgi:hypothetical protein